MPEYSFAAILIRPEGVGTWTYLNIPPEVSAAFGSKGQVKVKGTVNRYPFRSTALPHGDGTHYLVIGKEMRDQIHATQGDTVQVTIELDLADRQVELPEDVEQALSVNPQVMGQFDKLALSHKKEYLNWILNAKQETTRKRRISKMLEMLAQGKKFRS